MEEKEKKELIELVKKSMYNKAIECPYNGWDENIKLYSDWLKSVRISKKHFSQEIGKNESDIGQILLGKRKLSKPTKALFRLFKENYELKKMFNK